MRKIHENSVETKMRLASVLTQIVRHTHLGIMIFPIRVFRKQVGFVSVLLVDINTHILRSKGTGQVAAPVHGSTSARTTTRSHSQDGQGLLILSSTRAGLGA